MRMVDEYRVLYLYLGPRAFQIAVLKSAEYVPIAQPV